ncbi:unnamed protein product [Malus baccata var. baccata]
MAILFLPMKLLPLLFLLFNSVMSTTLSSSATESFLQCFTSHIQYHFNSSDDISKIIITKNNSNYSSVLQSSIHNLRFWNTSTPKPEAIIAPFHYSHVQAAVICSKKEGILIKTRSGGHDYEGVSYVSGTPFIIIDLFNLRSIDVDIEKESAWVEAGATVRELSYAIAQKSKLYGFPAGICHTVGVGGHISGGGHGTLFRKFGLAADNVLDAMIVDVNGNVLNRKSMGEELFWAIRGGGGSSFGVIVAWKLRLVPVPTSVTVYRESKTIEEGATELLSKWQAIADTIPEEYFLRLVLLANQDGTNGGKVITVLFDCLFLETVEKLLPWMQENFPELSLDQTKFTEMSWIDSVLYFSGIPRNESELLLQRRTEDSNRFFKAKSDYVTDPISEAGLEHLWKILLEEERSVLILTPFGGKMSEISDSETPFPHRKGTLFEIQYMIFWNDDKETEKHIGWMRRLYEYMTPHVSKSPRAAYLNYRDLDLGRNIDDGSTGYEEASIWGLKYFKGNFMRLVNVKTVVDPDNFFWDEQSIPVLPLSEKLKCQQQLGGFAATVEIQ